MVVRCAGDCRAIVCRHTTITVYSDKWSVRRTELSVGRRKTFVLQFTEQHAIGIWRAQKLSRIFCRKHEGECEGDWSPVHPSGRSGNMHSVLASGPDLFSRSLSRFSPEVSNNTLLVDTYTTHREVLLENYPILRIADLNGRFRDTMGALCGQSISTAIFSKL